MWRSCCGQTPHVGFVGDAFEASIECCWMGAGEANSLGESLSLVGFERPEEDKIVSRGEDSWLGRLVSVALVPLSSRRIQEVDELHMASTSCGPTSAWRGIEKCNGVRSWSTPAP